MCDWMRGGPVLRLPGAAVVTGLAAMTPSAINTPAVHLTLLLLFATGGILFLWVDQSVRHMNPDITRVPALLYTFALRTVVYVSIVLSALYLLLLSAFAPTAGWWKAPSVLLAYSCLVAWLLLTGDGPRLPTLKRAPERKRAQSPRRTESRRKK